MSNEDHQKESEHSRYMPVEEAMHILGYKKTKFYDEVERGLIPSELPEGKQRGRLFPREAILILAERKRREQAQRRPVPVYQFVPSTYSDLWNAVQNARRVYDAADVISFQRALEWRDENPDISMSVLDGKHFAGMATYLPVEEEIALALAEGRLYDQDVPPKAIRKWNDANLSVYVAGIAILSTNNQAVNRRRGRFLISHAVKWAITLTSQYDIRRWYGVGTSSEGQGLLEQLGFEQISSLEGGQRKGYKLENLLHPSTRLAQRFLSRFGNPADQDEV